MQQDNVLFREVQRFRQPWLWAIMLGCTLPIIAYFGYGMVKQLILHQEWTGSGKSDAELLIGGTIAIVVTLITLSLFGFLRLITEVRSDGLYVRFFPFHFSFKRIPLEDVETFEAVTYRPLLQYGGWGIRFTRGGKTYNVSGNRGVRLNFTNGRHLLIGSHKANELTQAIESVFQLFPGRGGSFQGDCAGSS